MIRVAQERVAELFGLAESEARTHSSYTDRYVALARKVGMRYNVRLLPEYRELYCRRCSAFWVEGRTVRTRFRHGRRARTCLRCGAIRRVPIHPPTPSTAGVELTPDRFVREEEVGLAETSPDEDDEFVDDEPEDG
jgi:ribonuclease P protein subunit RPR2